MGMIAFRDVRLTLGGRVVLDGVDLDVETGEFVGVLGPNGAGKTTLMRAVLGLLPPSQGTITVFGRPASRGNPAIGYVPQLRGTTGGIRLSGRDVVASVVDGHRPGVAGANRKARAEAERVLDLVGAAGLAGRPVNAMSGGERQRLLLAQALIGRPRLLLLDEPLISLDPHHQTEAIALVRSLQSALGITVLFSAHDLNALLGAMDRVLYLARGQAALGTVDAVMTPPVLSRLYGSPIEVMRVKGRIFVLSGGVDVAAPEHRHDDAAMHV